MNYTEKYHLPQWAKEDRIMMEDFNGAMASIESGIDTAHSEAMQAQESAAELPYAVGSYTGNGSTQDITVGFRPRFVFVCGYQGTSTPSGGYTIMAAANVDTKRLFLTDNGFQVVTHTNGHIFPRINENGSVYDFIAFR